MKRFASLNDCDEPLRQSPVGLTHLRARLRREAIVSRCKKG
jgi:hypothetical protein